MWQQIYDKQRALGGKEKRCGRKNVERDKEKEHKRDTAREDIEREKKVEKITKRKCARKDRKRVSE